MTLMRVARSQGHTSMSTEYTHLAWLGRISPLSTSQARPALWLGVSTLMVRSSASTVLPDSPIQYSLSSLVSLPLTTAQFPKPGGFMSKAIRTTLSLVVSLVLLSALTMAQPGGSNADKDKNRDKNKEHHSRLTKFAFWRHHK